jgi:polysaccharide pyruvyl transferase WcaK-like protein
MLLRTLFSNTFSLCSSLNVRDQVSHTYENYRQNYSFVYFNL